MSNIVQKLADRVVQGIDETFLMSGAKKKRLATLLLEELIIEEGLTLAPRRLSDEIEAAVWRSKRRRWGPVASSIALFLVGLASSNLVLAVANA